MLVLRRKVGEGIIIDDQIEVSVLRVCGDRVRLGFVAPSTVRILRSEVTNKVVETAFIISAG
jgi:carbon storage regulator